MERYEIILIKFKALFDDLVYYLTVKVPCSFRVQAEVDARMNLLIRLNDCRHYFETKLDGLEIMHTYTLEKSRIFEHTSEGQYIKRERDEVAIFFEAYLNTLFSLLE